jgi:hypothetical protein
LKACQFGKLFLFVLSLVLMRNMKVTSTRHTFLTPFPCPIRRPRDSRELAGISRTPRINGRWLRLDLCVRSVIACAKYPDSE